MYGNFIVISLKSVFFIFASAEMSSCPAHFYLRKVGYLVAAMWGSKNSEPVFPAQGRASGAPRCPPWRSRPTSGKSTLFLEPLRLFSPQFLCLSACVLLMGGEFCPFIWMCILYCSWLCLIKFQWVDLI